MDGSHDHDGLVATYGLCTVCAAVDIREQRAARDEGIARAQANAIQTWLNRAVKAIRDLAAERDTITSDDVWLRVPRCPEPRAMGAAFTIAADAGVIVRTDQTVISQQPSNHARPVRVWASTQPHLTTETPDADQDPADPAPLAGIHAATRPETGETQPEEP